MIKDLALAMCFAQELLVSHGIKLGSDNFPEERP
jgi:hypothetical protein